MAKTRVLLHIAALGSVVLVHHVEMIVLLIDCLFVRSIDELFVLNAHLQYGANACGEC